MPVLLRILMDRVSDAALGRTPLLRHVHLLAAMARRRFDRHRLFVGWFLDGDENEGSARVRGFIPHAYLRQRGVHSVILSKPRRKVLFTLRPEEIDLVVGAKFDVVVFQRVGGPDPEELARRLGAAGTRTVHAVGDLVPTGMPKVVDAVVVASDGLKKLAHEDIHKVTRIEGVVETPPHLVKDYSRVARRPTIKVVWVGYPENLVLLDPVREALRSPRLAGYELVVISRGPQATHQWDRHRVWKWILDCDIAVLPSTSTDWYDAKPNTRLVMFKALAMPVVASPVPSYLATLEHGRGCYYARDVEEWVQYLEMLADPDRRREVGLAGRDEILRTYGFETIGRRWLDLFEALARTGRAPVVAGAE